MRKFILLILSLLLFSSLSLMGNDDVASMMRDALNHTYGMGGKNKDLKKALALYEKAAKTNNRDALFSLAECYRFGFYDTVDIDTDKAIALYKSAANRGSAEALDALADMGIDYTPSHNNNQEDSGLVAYGKYTCYDYEYSKVIDSDIEIKFYLDYIELNGEKYHINYKDSEGFFYFEKKFYAFSVVDYLFNMAEYDRIYGLANEKEFLLLVSPDKHWLKVQPEDLTIVKKGFSYSAYHKNLVDQK